MLEQCLTHPLLLLIALLVILRLALFTLLLPAAFPTALLLLLLQFLVLLLLPSLLLLLPLLLLGLLADTPGAVLGAGVENFAILFVLWQELLYVRDDLLFSFPWRSLIHIHPPLLVVADRLPPCILQLLPR